MKTILLVGLLLVIPVAQNAGADWQDGRVAWYSFNGGYGDSVNGYNATNYNTTLTTDSSGNTNSACLFSNYMDRVELPYEVLDGKNDFTVFAQIKVAQSSAITPTILSGANHSNLWGNEAFFVTMPLMADGKLMFMKRRLSIPLRWPMINGWMWHG